MAWSSYLTNKNTVLNNKAKEEEKKETQKTSTGSSATKTVLGERQTGFNTSSSGSSSSAKTSSGSSATKTVLGERQTGFNTSASGSSSGSSSSSSSSAKKTVSVSPSNFSGSLTGRMNSLKSTGKSYTPYSERKKTGNVFTPSTILGKRRTGFDAVTTRKMKNQYVKNIKIDGLSDELNSALGDFISKYKEISALKRGGDFNRAVSKLISESGGLLEKYRKETGRELTIPDLMTRVDKQREKDNKNRLDEQYNRRLESYYAVLQNPDFTEYTQNPRRGNGYNRVEKAINNAKFMNLSEMNEGAAAAIPRYYGAESGREYGVGGIDRSDVKLLYMTDAEKDIYKYYRNKYGEDEAEKFIRDITPTLDERATSAYKTIIQKASNENKAAGAVYDVVYGMSQFPAWLNALKQGIEQKNALPNEYVPYNPYTEAAEAVHGQAAAREGITQDMSGFGKSAAETGLSIAENAARIPFGNAGLLMMGANVAGQSAVNSGMNGQTNALKAAGTGAVYGGVEIATEKIPLDNIYKVLNAPPTSLKSAVVTLLKNAATEATEEAISNVADNVADKIINGDSSEYEQYKRQLMQSGKSESEAAAEAFAKFYLADTGVSAIQGGISGAILNAGSMAAGAYNDTVNTGRGLKDLGVTQDVIDTGLESDEAAAANRYAQRMRQKRESGKDLSDWNVGRQYQKNINAIAAEDSLRRSVESATGVPVETKENIFTPTGREANGRYTPSSAAGERTRFIPRGGIDLSENSSLSQAQTLGHEITHAMKENAPTAYKALEDYIIEAARETNAEAVNERMTELKEKYGYSDATAKEEIAADTVREFFGDKKSVDDIIKSNPTLADKIRDGIKSVKAGIRDRISSPYRNKAEIETTYKQLTEIEKRFNDGLKEMAENYKADGGDSGETNPSAAYGGSSPNRGALRDGGADAGGEKYDIVKTDDGKEYVEATRQVIKGESVSEWRKSVTSFFNEMLKDGDVNITTSDGATLTITKDTAKKARDNYKQENGKRIRMTDGEFLVKLNAESHIDELSEISKPAGNNTDSKNHSFAKDGFTYRDVYFKDFDNSYYKITLSIGNNNGVATVYNVGKIKTDTAPTGKIISRERGQSPIARVSDRNSISDTGGKVKYSAKENAEQTRIGNTGLESRLSGDDLLNAYDTIDVIKDVGGKVDKNGFAYVYHNTSKENADKIKKTGKMTAKENGIFVSTKADGQTAGYGDTTVELNVPVERLVLDDIFDDEAHFRIPLKNKFDTLDVSDFLANENNPDIRYSVKEDGDGEAYIEIDEDILDGVEAKDYVRTVRNVLRDKFKGGIDFNGNTVTVSGKSAKEFTSSTYTRNMPEGDRANKFRMSNNLDEIINAQRDTKSETPNHIRKDDITGFDRGKVTVKVGNDEYTADVLLANKKDGSQQFYDVINLEPTKIQRSNTGRAKSEITVDRNAVSSDNSISDEGGNVKYSVKENEDADDVRPSTTAVGGGPPSSKSANAALQDGSEKRKVIDEYEAAVDEDLLSFIERAKENPNDNRSVFMLNDVSDRLTKDIKRLTKIDTSDFGNVIKNNSITHIENDHGAEGATDNSMADDRDIARIQYVIDNYDDIELLDDVSGEYRDKEQNPAPLIKLSKRIDGTYYVVEAVPDTRKHQLAVVSAYKNKAAQQMGVAQSHNPNVRNASADTALSGNSISDTGGNVKYSVKENAEQTRTEQFKRWFGDWENDPEHASKVVNEDGTPKVVYHGTNAKFNIFNKNKFNTNERSGDYVGEGFFFTKRRATAHKYGANTIEAYLDIRKPLVINTEADAQNFRASFLGQYTDGKEDLRELIGGDYDYFSIMEEHPEDIRKELQRRGYDGLIDNLYGQYAVFNPEQIKSATDNTGAFDKSNPDIRYSVKEDGEEISVETTETREAVKDFNTARNSFIEYARNNFPKSVTNAETGKEIGISRKGLDKFLSGNITAEKLASGYEIPRLVGTASKVGEATDNKGRENISGYEYYYNTLTIDGNPYDAHIRVRNTNMGDKYYGHTISGDISSIEIEPMTRTHNENSSSQPVKEVIDSTTDSISDTGGNVKYSVKENEEEFSPKGLAARLINDYGAKVKKSEIAADIEEIRRVLGADITDGAPSEAASTEAWKLSEELGRRIADAITAADTDMYDTYSDLRAYLRKTPIKYYDDYKSETGQFENYEELRKKYFGTLRLSKDGTGIDSVYKELSAMYPNFFNEETETTPAVQLERILDVLDTVSKKEYALSGEDYDAAVEEIAARVFTEAVSDAANPSARDGGKITAESTEAERYRILRDKTIKIPEYDKGFIGGGGDYDLKKLETAYKKDAKPLLKKLAEEFGVFKDYQNKDIDLEFRFSGRSFSESLNKQKSDYLSFAKMLRMFDEVVDNAVGIEVHKDRYAGGERADPGLQNMYVLFSAYKDGDWITPIKLEVKELANDKNKLYVAVALQKIKAEISAQASSANNAGLPYAPSTFEYSLSDLFEKVNRKDTDLTKYIPKGFLKDYNGDEFTKQNIYNEDDAKFDEQFFLDYKSEEDFYRDFETGSDKMSEVLAKLYMNGNIPKSVIDKIRSAHNSDVKTTYMEKRRDAADRQKLLNVARRINKMNLSPENQAKVPAILNHLDTLGIRILEKGYTKQNDDGTFTKVMGRVDLSELKQKYYELAKTDPDFEPDKKLEAKIGRLDNKQIGDMDISQVRELTEVLQQVEHEQRTHDRLLGDEKNRKIAEIGERVRSEVRASKGSNYLKSKDRFLDKYNTINLSATREFRRLSGYATNGALEELGNALNDGQRKSIWFKQQASRIFDELISDKKQIKRFTGKDAELIDISKYAPPSPNKTYITPAMRVSLYLASQNSANRKHMKVGGITIPEINLYMKGKYNEALARGTRIKLTRSQLNEITSGMSEYEMKFAQAAQTFFNKLSKKAINETSMEIEGYEKARVENYFPIISDEAFTKQEFTSLIKDGTLEGLGMLKDREGGTNPIVLEDVIAAIKRHTNNVGDYYGLAVPIRNFNKVYKSGKAAYGESTQNVIGQKWGTNATEYIKNLITDLQSRRKQPSGILDKFKSAFAQSTLSFNPSVTLKQAASYPTAGAVVGYKALARGLTQKVTAEDRAIIDKYTPLLWYRSQGYMDSEVGDYASQASDWTKAAAPRRLGMGWIQKTDIATTTKLWKAAECYVEDNFKDLEYKSDAFYKQTAEIYNRIIEETQPNYTVMQRPDLLRNPNKALGLVTMFRTQLEQNYNLLYDAVGEYSAKRNAYKSDKSNRTAAAEYKAASQKLGQTLSSQAVASLVIATMTAAGDLLKNKLKDKTKDEDGRNTTRSAVKYGLENFTSSFAGSFLGGSEALSLFMAMFDDSHKWYDIDASVFNGINDAASAIVSLGGLVGDGIEEGFNDYRDFIKPTNNLIKAIGTLTGVPVTNVENYVGGIVQDLAACLDKAGVIEKNKLEYLWKRFTKNQEDNKSAFKSLLKDTKDKAEELPEDSKRKFKAQESYSYIYNDMLKNGFSEDELKKAVKDKEAGDEFGKDISKPAALNDGIPTFIEKENETNIAAESDRLDDYFDEVGFTKESGKTYVVYDDKTYELTKAQAINYSRRINSIIQKNKAAVIDGTSLIEDILPDYTANLYADEMTQEQYDECLAKAEDRISSAKKDSTRQTYTEQRDNFVNGKTTREVSVTGKYEDLTERVKEKVLNKIKTSAADTVEEEMREEIENGASLVYTAPTHARNKGAAETETEKTETNPSVSYADSSPVRGALGADAAANTASGRPRFTSARASGGTSRSSSGSSGSSRSSSGGTSRSSSGSSRSSSGGTSRSSSGSSGGSSSGSSGRAVFTARAGNTVKAASPATAATLSAKRSSSKNKVSLPDTADPALIKQAIEEMIRNKDISSAVKRVSLTSA